MYSCYDGQNFWNTRPKKGGSNTRLNFADHDDEAINRLAAEDRFVELPDGVPVARLDHIVVEVADIEASHAHLTQTLQYPEAWPTGPFWPQALTSGVAVGGFNLELVQPLDRPARKDLTTLVFEPTDLDIAEQWVTDLGLTPTRAQKIEGDPELLSKRGFPSVLCKKPLEICTNILVEGDMPFPFFFCLYNPFLAERLNPLWFQPPHGRARKLLIPRCPGIDEFVVKAGYHASMKIQSTETGPAEISYDDGVLNLETLVFTPS